MVVARGTRSEGSEGAASNLITFHLFVLKRSLSFVALLDTGGKDWPFPAEEYKSRRKIVYWFNSWRPCSLHYLPSYASLGGAVMALTHEEPPGPPHPTPSPQEKTEERVKTGERV